MASCTAGAGQDGSAIRCLTSWLADFAGAGIPGIRYQDEGSRTLAASDMAKLQADLRAAEEVQRKYPQFGWANTDVARYRKAIAEEAAQAANPTYNYVGIDPSKLDILAKYGLAGGAAGFGTLAAQDTYK